MNYPYYKIVVNPDDDEELMTCVSLVDFPAVEVDFLAFNKQKPEDNIKLFSFGENALERKITGVAIRANYPIYRYDRRGDYYVYFDEETIENIVLKYSKMGMNNLVSLQHDGNLVDGVYMIEYFIKDSKKGIVPTGFEDIEDGSLFCTYKIENEEVWQKIVNGEINGFSIEVMAEMERVDNIEIPLQEDEDYLNSLINELLKDFDVDILFSEEPKKKINIDKLIDENKYIEIKIKDSSKIIKGWIYTEYVVEGSKNLAVWDNSTWHTINKNNIKDIVVRETKIVPNWQNALKHPDFDTIHNTVKEADGVKKKADTPNNFWEDVIMNHKILMLKYDDESGEGCTTYRQVLACEYGYTTAGNTCIRAYEYSGATHTNDINPLPSWRNFLTKRMIEVKVAPGVFEPITTAPIGFNPGADKDGFVAIIKAKFSTDEEDK